MHAELERHLLGPGPKRILTLDGGGARGLVTLGMLKAMEDTLRARSPLPPGEFRLCQYFDLIAGTSTGSIIATALALGWTVDQVHEMYLDVCPKVFKEKAKGWFRHVFGTDPIEQALKEILKDRKLETEDLKTGLMICAKRIDTGSPWVLTNNPRSAYWSNESGSYLPNKDYELWRIIRASTAAPYYFEPVRVVINDNPRFPRDEGLFVDGGVAGLNNPSWQAFLTATLPPYGFNWAAGKDNIFVVSIGAGWWRMRNKLEDFENAKPWEQAIKSLAAMIQDTSLHTILTLQALSEPRKPWHINSEVKDLRGQRVEGMELLSYQRYDAMIDDDVIRRLPGMGAAKGSEVETLRDSMRAIGTNKKETMQQLYALGFNSSKPTRPGYDGIEPADFPATFDPIGFKS